MDWTVVYHALVSTQTPALPHPIVMRLALHVTWAIVLGWGAMLLGSKLPRPYRLGLTLGLLVWALVPGAASPAYWLGLAFQTPSLMTTVICLWGLLAMARPAARRGAVLNPAQIRALKLLGLGGVALGWLLLLDTFALLPFPFYAWGFSAAALAVVALLASVLWIFSGAAPGRRIVSWLAMLVLTLFVLTRLPTGNLWDALIDPWLWGLLQLGWITRFARRLMARWRASRATRA